MDHLLSIPLNAVTNAKNLAQPRVSKVLAAFLDISGYTRFAEDIIANSRTRGLGQLVDELERILVPTATAALRHNGNIVTVEGDALLITFQDSEKLLRFCEEIQPFRETTARTRDVAYPLCLDIGISHGRIYEFVAGDGNGRVYVAAGSALRGACAMEKHSRGGKIALSFALRGATNEGDHYAIDPKELCAPRRRKEADGFLKLLDRRGFVVPLKPEAEKDYLDSFTANLPPNVYSQLLSPVIAFTNLPLIRQAFSRVAPTDGSAPDPAFARDAIQELYLGAREIIERQAEGLIAKFRDDGAMFLFGAPRVSDNAPLRAFEAMLRFDDLHGDLCERFGLRRHRICCGMHRGDALCGSILGRYDAVGASANLAARIKESAVRADGSGVEHARGRRIRFSRELLEDERVAQMVRGYAVSRQHLQGLEGTVSIIFDFSSMLDLRKATGEAFVLRKAELERLIELIRERTGQPGAGAIVNVVGDIGSGKDRLLHRIARELDREVRTYAVRCSPFHRDDPYWTVLELMKTISRVPTEDELYARAIGRTPHNERDLSAVLDHFRRRLKSVPSLLLINNGENIDRESAGFFATLAEDLVASGSVAIYSGTAPLFPSGELIDLAPLDSQRCREFARAMAAQHHAGMELEPDQLDEIHRSSRGNPLFIAELVRSMEERQERLVMAQVPESLRDALLRKVQDAVGNSPALREALEKYSLMHSVSLMAPLTDENAEQNIPALAGMGFLGITGEFINDLLRTTISEAIDPRRREAHCAELSQAAERAGLQDHLALFEYYRQGPLNSETQRRALEHAAAHLADPGHAALIRDGFYEDLVDIVELSDPAQRSVCGELLLRRAEILATNAADETAAERAYRMGNHAHNLLKGSDGECFALLAMAEASSRQAWLKQEAEGPQAARSSLVDALRCYEEAREHARDGRSIIGFWTISSAYADTLAGVGGKAFNAQMVLQEAERRAASLPPLAVSEEGNALGRRIDRSFAFAAIELGELEEARWNLDLAREKAELAESTVDVLRCAALEARLLLKRGDKQAAERSANEALKLIDSEGINLPDLTVEFRALLARSG